MIVIIIDSSMNGQTMLFSKTTEYILEHPLVSESRRVQSIIDCSLSSWKRFLSKFAGQCLARKRDADKLSFSLVP